MKFNKVVEKAEFEKLSSEEEEDMEESNQSEEELEQVEGIDSDDDDMQSGLFISLIRSEQIKAEKERKFLMKELKANERRGSIFIDEVSRVVAGVQRESGKYDYLIEWKYNNEDGLTPTSSIVKGSHFVFTKPLMFRRYIEKTYVDTQPPKQVY